MTNGCLLFQPGVTFCTAYAFTCNPIGTLEDATYIAKKNAPITPPANTIYGVACHIVSLPIHRPITASSFTSPPAITLIRYKQKQTIKVVKNPLTCSHQTMSCWMTRLATTQDNRASTSLLGIRCLCASETPIEKSNNHITKVIMMHLTLSGNVIACSIYCCADLFKFISHGLPET